MFFRVRTRNSLPYPTRRRREKSETDVIKNTYVTVQKVLNQKEKEKKPPWGNRGRRRCQSYYYGFPLRASSIYATSRCCSRKSPPHLEFSRRRARHLPPSDGGVHWGGCRGTIFLDHIFSIDQKKSIFSKPKMLLFFQKYRPNRDSLVIPKRKR